MKKNLFFILLFLAQCYLLIGQTPQAFNYQAVARDKSGNVLVDFPVKLRISILQGSVSGTDVYVEKQSLVTNNVGVISIEIGNGTPVSGSFASINWGDNKYFLKMEIDIDGNGYVYSGTSQLLSVPYALYAEKANVPGVAGPTGPMGPTGPKGDTATIKYTAGEGIEIKGKEISNSSPDRTVTITGSDNVKVSGAYPDFAIKGFPCLTQEQIDTLKPYEDMIVYNKTTKSIDYYSGENWYGTQGVCIPQPTKAYAGPDQQVISGTTTKLAANTPVEGTGQWSIISGSGGQILTPASPTSSFTGQAETKYTLSWTITNKCGVSSDTVFIWFWPCGGEITDSRDGKTYKTIIIGSQCWMAQNLDVGTKISGTDQTDNNEIEKYCYDDNESNCILYGGLYQWNEMMQYVTTDKTRGICPAGWHLPGDKEWKQLEMFLGMSQYDADKESYRGTDEGGKLKEAGFEHWKNPNLGATNSSGFTALPAGVRSTTGFFDLGLTARFWTSTQYSNGSPCYRNLSTNFMMSGRYNNVTSAVSTSVRCIKD